MNNKLKDWKDPALLLAAFVFSYFVMKPQKAEFYQEEEADNEVLV